MSEAFRDWYQKIDEWINFGASDLNSAVTLFENGDLRNGLFLLQQASEKLAKSILLFMFFTFDDRTQIFAELEKEMLSTRQLNHKPYRELLKMFKGKYDTLSDYQDLASIVIKYFKGMSVSVSGT